MGQKRDLMLTLRQIEVIRAVMVIGTINGAAKLLNVSAPGISRIVKHSEKSLGIQFFQRKNGRFFPTAETEKIFEQINLLYEKVDDLNFILGRMERGDLSELRIASVPSISQSMVPRAAALVNKRFPDLRMDINVLKLEEAIDYLLLGKGECVAMSHKFEHPNLVFEPLAFGELFCIVPEHHPLAAQESIGAAEITRFPLIGIDPHDPFGRIMVEIFTRNRLDYTINIKARFGTTVCALVRAGLGIAVIDKFTVAHDSLQGVKLLRIDEPTRYETYIARRRDGNLSRYADYFVQCLRKEMNAESAAPLPGLMRTTAKK